MKQSKEKKTEVDLLVPVVSNNEPAEGDCFGIEYDARAHECNLCADIELCGVIYTEHTKKKIKKFETEQGPLLDQIDFAAVDMSKVEKLVRKYEAEGEPMTFEELQDLIKAQANTKDDEAVIQFIKRELPLTLIYLNEGLCLAR